MKLLDKSELELVVGGGQAEPPSETENKPQEESQIKEFKFTESDWGFSGSNKTVSFDFDGGEDDFKLNWDFEKNTASVTFLDGDYTINFGQKSNGWGGSLMIDGENWDVTLEGSSDGTVSAKFVLPFGP